jgi:hypothetical protein
VPSRSRHCFASCKTSWSDRHRLSVPYRASFRCGTCGAAHQRRCIRLTLGQPQGSLRCHRAEEPLQRDLHVLAP